MTEQQRNKFKLLVLMYTRKFNIHINITDDNYVQIYNHFIDSGGQSMVSRPLVSSIINLLNTTTKADFRAEASEGDFSFINRVNNINSELYDVAEDLKTYMDERISQDDSRVWFKIILCIIIVLCLITIDCEMNPSHCS